MSYPIPLSRSDGVPDWSLVCPVPQVFTGDSIGPFDAKDPSQACVDEDLQLVLQPFGGKGMVVTKTNLKI